MKFLDKLPLVLAALLCASASAFATASLSTYLDLGEISAPSVSAAGSSRLYADSTAHAIKVSSNGGAFGAIPVDGGNSLGATLTLGTNDAQSLALESSGTTRVTLTATTLTSTLPITLPVGATTATSVNFASDPNTGVYSPGADQVALVTGGTARFTLSTSAMTTTLPLRGQDGSAAAPALSFSGDTNCGIFRATTDVLAFSTAGTERARIDASGSLLVATTTSISGKELLVSGDIQSTTVEINNGTDGMVSSVILSEAGTSEGVQVVPSVVNRRAEFYLLPNGTPTAGVGNYGVGTMGGYMAIYGTLDGSDNVVAFAAGTTGASVMSLGAGQTAPPLSLGSTTGTTFVNVVTVDGALGELTAGQTGQKIGFLGATPITRPSITGSRGGNAALASLLTAGANLGLWTDSTSP